MTPPTKRVASALSAPHKAVARMVGISLSLLSTPSLRERLPGTDWNASDIRTMQGLAAVIRAKLVRPERQALAWAAMLACDNADAQAVADGTVEDDAGNPIAMSEDVEGDAIFWSSMASTHELQCYAMACLSHLPEDDRQGIVDALKGRRAR